MLLQPNAFLLFTDHKNMTYIFNPAACNLQIMKHVANKVECWALLLSGFRYQDVHISGEDNVWADLLSRWGSPYQQRPIQGSIKAIFQAPHAPEFDAEFTWPTVDEISKSQQASIQEGDEIDPSNRNSQGLIKAAKGCVWIPRNDRDLQLRICIIGHTGRGGHRGAKTTFENIFPYFSWRDMKTEIASFVNSCLHCVSTTGGLPVPRPMAHAIHADKPSEVIHFDFLLMHSSDEGLEYVLIVKDDASSFVWLEPCAAPYSETTVSVLLRWFSTFGVVRTWVSDRGFHFKNEVMKRMNKALYAHHHLTRPASPKSN